MPQSVGMNKNQTLCCFCSQNYLVVLCKMVKTWDYSGQILLFRDIELFVFFVGLLLLELCCLSGVSETTYLPL